MGRALQRGLFDELIIDNFAGGGGASHGIELALNRPIDIAVNHDPEAVAMHKANHPYTRHYCEDVWTVNPVKIAHGRPVGLAWFSPDCKHHSKAKGGIPVSKKIRGLAWVAIKWARMVRPRIIFLENVEEFEEWGPVIHACDKDGFKLFKDGEPVMKPCQYNKGKTFNRWVARLKNFGYEVDWREMRACDYGAPTIRKRLFLIARCDGLPIVWPGETHGPGLIPYRTAAECIDWTIPTPSIFDRKKPLVPNTLKRIAKGIWRYVINTDEPFIAPTLGLDGNQALAAHHIQRQFGQGVGSKMGCPIGAITAGGMGKTALVSALLATHYGKSGDGIHMNTLFNTVTPKDKHALVASHLIKFRGTCRDGQSVRKPYPTVTAGGLHIGEVRSFLIKYYGTACGQTLKEPVATVTTKDRLGLVSVAGVDYQIADIGMRMLSPRELYRAQGFNDDYIIDPIYNGKPLTKTAQVRMCGNSVSPYPAKALVEANVKLKAVKIAA